MNLEAFTSIPPSRLANPVTVRIPASVSEATSVLSPAWKANLLLSSPLLSTWKTRSVADWISPSTISVPLTVAEEVADVFAPVRVRTST